jgi:hypothetical protein
MGSLAKAYETTLSRRTDHLPEFLGWTVSHIDWPLSRLWFRLVFLRVPLAKLTVRILFARLRRRSADRYKQFDPHYCDPCSFSFCVCRTCGIALAVDPRPL